MDYVEADRIFWETFFPEGEDDCDEPQPPSTASNDDGLDGDF